ncbi:MAG TPA: allantoinase AllB [Intrasporangium sp.]|uniref:allantoinase AllB n=1 Tax=Intrasporangium sp. TaxID=1925024 RepID=UPI002D7995EC|nr:allantoinase AllB [Intrasporangium sp.]HET7397008.1 allantoinase AllB [Intrasporangium sp.]
MAPEVVIRAPRAVVGGVETGATVSVVGGRIAAVGPFDADVELAHDAEVVELAEDEVLLPGLVDTHVHVNEPGRTDWEGFASATRAAAAGGVTTIVDMPLNSIPPTVTVAALEQKRAVARDQAYVDVGFWGGAIPDNLEELRPLHEAGVFGFKCFLLHSGVDEFPHLSPPQLREALAEAATFGGMVIVHAEDAETIDSAPEPKGRGYAGFLGSRPKEAEERAIGLVVDAARETGARAHILHLSDADALPLIARARAEGVRLSVETCPHYLTLEAEEIPDGATQFKCCPPIREHANRDRLWAGLADGTIATIVSDHSPCTADLKRLDSGDFGQAWGGIAGLQLGLPAIWTEARQRGHTLADVVRWMAQGPADQVGLADRGRIAVGATADLVAFAPEESFRVDVASLHHKNPVSAYAGRTLTGVVRRTWLAGIPIDVDAAPRGRLLRRGQP